MKKVSEIYIYPIKSLGGVSVQTAKLSSRGLQHDRRFMLTTPNGQFMTQRSNRRMALFRTTINDTHLVIQDSSSPTHKIEIPLAPKYIHKQQEVTIWGDTCTGNVVHPKINKWFSEHLKQDCQLVYMPEETKRLTSIKDRQGEEVVSFADAYPLLVFGRAGMNQLNKKLQQPVSINRFRANVIYTGGKPFEEDKWKVFTIGKQPFRGVKPCKRCNVLNINQFTAEIDKEPNRTLATFRKFNNNIYVGMNVCWKGKKAGILKVGEVVKVDNR